jgi:hypothetical protein
MTGIPFLFGSRAGSGGTVKPINSHYQLKQLLAGDSETGADG